MEDRRIASRSFPSLFPGPLRRELGRKPCQFVHRNFDKVGRATSPFSRSPLTTYYLLLTTYYLLLTAYFPISPKSDHRFCIIAGMRTLVIHVVLVSFAVCLSCGGSVSDRVEISGSLQVWHPITLTVQGPAADEGSDPSPFVDHRLLIFFDHSSAEESVIVPGYFAADGLAAETGATSGNKWRAHFVPAKTGLWKYRISFRSGDRIALDSNPLAGAPVVGDGVEGEFTVKPGPNEPFHAFDRGKLRYVGERYLRFPATEEDFLKSGADSPENFLAYTGFDGPAGEGRKTGEAREGSSCSETQLCPTCR